MASIRKSILSGSVWTIVGQLSSMLILLLANVWLARLLSPQEFGQVGIIMFFIMLGQVFTESGLSGALIRKKEISREDYSTIFVFNLFISLFLYALLVLFSKPIAAFYNDDSLAPLLNATGLILIINALQFVQNTRILHRLRFKRKTVYRNIAVFVGSVVGIVFAYCGAGVWALVYLQIAISLTTTVLYYLFEKFGFGFRFSRKSFQEMYAFGINTTLASLLNVGFNNIYQLLLGKFFSIAQVGFYDQGKKLQSVPESLVAYVSQGVIYPSLCKIQDRKSVFQKTQNQISLICFMVMGLISVLMISYADRIVILLYGPRWSDVVPYLQMLSIAGFFYSQELVNRILFKVFNQTKKLLWLEVFKKSFQAVTIVVGLVFADIWLLLLGLILTNIFGYLINFYYSGKIMGRVNWSELFILLKILLASGLTIILTLGMNSHLSLYYGFLSMPLSVLLYFAGLHIFRVGNILTIAKQFKKSLNR